MREKIRIQLQKMSDAEYQKFSSSLIPGSGQGTMLGVRLPALRDYAKELSRGDWRKELSASEDLFFEETMLRGMILGYACKEIDELLRYLEDFIPRVKNWSVCDSVCNSLKLAEKYPKGGMEISSALSVFQRRVSHEVCPDYASEPFYQAGGRKEKPEKAHGHFGRPARRGRKKPVSGADPESPGPGVCRRLLCTDGRGVAAGGAVRDLSGPHGPGVKRTAVG